MNKIKMYKIPCPLYKCGSFMKIIEREYPDGMSEVDFPNGMVGDFQIPDLVCENCHCVYSFTGFEKWNTKNI